MPESRQVPGTGLPKEAAAGRAIGRPRKLLRADGIVTFSGRTGQLQELREADGKLIGRITVGSLAETGLPAVTGC